MRSSTIIKKEDKNDYNESISLVENLMELQFKMMGIVRKKLAPYIEPLLSIPNKNDWLFPLCLDPSNAVDLENIHELSVFEGVTSKNFILNMKTYFESMLQWKITSTTLWSQMKIQDVLDFTYTPMRRIQALPICQRVIKYCQLMKKLLKS